MGEPLPVQTSLEGSCNEQGRQSGLLPSIPRERQGSRRENSDLGYYLYPAEGSCPPPRPRSRCGRSLPHLRPQRPPLRCRRVPRSPCGGTRVAGKAGDRRKGVRSYSGGDRLLTTNWCTQGAIASVRGCHVVFLSFVYNIPGALSQLDDRHAPLPRPSSSLDAKTLLPSPSPFSGRPRGRRRKQRGW